MTKIKKILIGQCQTFQRDNKLIYHIAYAYLTKEGGISRYYVEGDNKEEAANKMKMVQREYRKFGEVNHKKYEASR